MCYEGGRGRSQKTPSGKKKEISMAHPDRRKKKTTGEEHPIEFTGGERSLKPR